MDKDNVEIIFLFFCFFFFFLTISSKTNCLLKRKKKKKKSESLPTPTTNNINPIITDYEVSSFLSINKLYPLPPFFRSITFSLLLFFFFCFCASKFGGRRRRGSAGVDSEGDSAPAFVLFSFLLLFVPILWCCRVASQIKNFLARLSF
ncbi:unnamed protein product [Citrullus colocynthis]|uniref:Transmembrane protein n=1 Tax=Citrullus colocynthis TaxID=252529 RepID=A0ABP0YUU3_9ROSI